MDRFIEIDCDVFGPPFNDEHIAKQLRELGPLWEGAGDDGDVRGLVINFGWLMDIVTVWTGNPDQHLPIDSNRLSAWSTLTYRDLASLIDTISSHARQLGFGDIRVGPMMLGIGEFRTEIVKPPSESSEEEHRGAIYQEKSVWLDRHPELFPFPIALTLHGPGIDFRQPLNADTWTYAAYPDGIPNGTMFADFFSAQWAHLASYVGFSLLHLRDEFTSPIHSGRVSFTGDATPAAPGEIAEWSDHLIGVLTAIKNQSPETFLMIYSTGLSPAVERAYARVDISRVVAESPVDAWIEQTWGGAWQDWWDAGLQGWTFQYVHLLSRLAQIHDANRRRPYPPCRHYRLIQLLDGWEPYDTFHDYQDKLRWGMWAFTHAAITDPTTGELQRTAGSYLAFANNSRAELLTTEEIAWVAGEVNAAEDSAKRMTTTRGVSIEVGPHPTNSAAAPDVWMEEIAGFLMKFGVPLANAHVHPHDALPHPRIDSTASTSPTDAVAVVGDAAALPAALQKTLGVQADSPRIPPGYTISHVADPDLRKTFWPYYPSHTPVTTSGNEAVWSKESALSKQVGDTWWWLPPDIANPKDRRLPHYQIGAIEPHIVLARKILDHPRAKEITRIAPMSAHEPVTLLAWEEPGRHHVLLGNIESGWIGDSRYPRHVTVILPTIAGRSWADTAHTDQGDTVVVGDGSLSVIVPPESLLRLSIEFTDD